LGGGTTELDLAVFAIAYFAGGAVFVFLAGGETDTVLAEVFARADPFGVAEREAALATADLTSRAVAVAIATPGKATATETGFPGAALFVFGTET